MEFLKIEVVSGNPDQNGTLELKLQCKPRLGEVGTLLHQEPTRLNSDVGRNESPRFYSWALALKTRVQQRITIVFLRDETPP